LAVLAILLFAGWNESVGADYAMAAWSDSKHWAFRGYSCECCN
jgi:hypothetical protein